MMLNPRDWLKHLSLRTRKELRLAEAYRALFLADGKLRPHAENVLAHLRNFCGATMPSMRPGESDAMAIAYNEGRRSVWLDIVNKLELSDGQIIALTEPYYDQGDDL